MKRSVALSILAAFAAAEAAAQPLGRVFFSPAQRAQIVAGRQAASADAGSSPVVAAPTTARLSGIVRSSDGARLAWLDGRPVADGATHAGFVVRIGDSSVRLIGEGRELRLRAGETLDLASGERRSVAVIATEQLR